MFRQRPSVNDKLNSSRPATMPVLTDLEDETTTAAVTDSVNGTPEPDTTETPDVSSTADTPARALPSRKGTGEAGTLPSLDGINQRQKGRAAQRGKPARPAKAPKDPKAPKAPKTPKQATPVDRKKVLAAATAVTVLLAGGFVAVTQLSKPKVTVAITNPDNEILMPQGPLPATPVDPAAQPAPNPADLGNPAQPAGQMPADTTAPGQLTPPADLPNSPPELPVTATIPSPGAAAPAAPPVQMTGVTAKAVKPKPGAARIPDPFASADDAPDQPSAPTPSQALPAAVIPTPPRTLPPVAAAPITLPVPTRVVATPPRALPVPPSPAALPSVPAVPLPAPVVMVNPLETWVAEHELKFAAYAEGVTSQIILLSNVGSISVPLGSTIPQTDIKVTNLRPGAAATVTLTQGKYTLKLKIGGPQ